MNKDALPPMSDAILVDELRSIDIEVMRRKKAQPFEAYATWAYLERLEALSRFEKRIAA